MITINLPDFPNFFLPREYNLDLSWEEELLAVGIKSAVDVFGVHRMSMSKEDYTWFILRWT